MTDEYNPDTIDSIIQSVCDFIQINKEDLLSTKRDRLLVDSRRIAVNILLREESHSVSGVGRCIKKNHATVIHYRNSHVSIYDTNARYRHTYDMCVRKYKGESYSSFQDFLLMGKKVKAVEELLESRDQEIADLKYNILKLEKKVRMKSYQLV